MCLLTCAAGDCVSRATGIYQLLYHGRQVRCPLCDDCAGLLGGGDPIVTPEDALLLIRGHVCWCHLRTVRGECGGLVVSWCPTHGDYLASCAWLHCQDCNEDFQCDRHQQQHGGF